MDEKNRDLLYEFKSRFLPGDYVCSRKRDMLSTEEKSKKLDWIYEIQGVSENYTRSSSGNNDELLVILKCMWENQDMYHVSLKEFLGKRDSSYNFKRIAINKITTE